MHYMHFKDYIQHDFYVYSPVLITQYLGHCWQTPCTELYILRIRCITLLGCWENPPSPATGGGTIWLGRGRGVGVPAHIYIYIYTLKFKRPNRHRSLTKDRNAQQKNWTRTKDIIALKLYVFEFLCHQEYPDWNLGSCWRFLTHFIFPPSRAHA